MTQTNQLSDITDSTVTGRSRFCLEARTGGAPPLAVSLCLPKEHVTGSKLSCVARLVRQKIYIILSKTVSIPTLTLHDHSLSAAGERAPQKGAAQGWRQHAALSLAYITIDTTVLNISLTC